MSNPALYQAWFCPFAQRAWIGVLHRQLDIDIKEQDPYNKTPEWLKINPRGLVPTLIHNGKSIYESPILLEYLDEAFESQPGPSVFPKNDPYKRFQARIWGDYIDKKLVPPYYRMLQKKSKDEKEDAGKDILKGLKYMFDEKTYDGPFYLGNELSFVDIMLVPYAFRFKVVLKHFYDFTIPQENFETYHSWLDNMLNQDCVKNTLAAEDKLIQSYQRYADDTAVTEVADAIRKGTALP